ncbi:hypothetical protein [Kocuria sabuli]|uniref:hypothetical protein n=1 Tax=Kocuria sabuli TaxID=3071448 RepID=UPI0034D6AECD
MHSLPALSPTVESLPAPARAAEDTSSTPVHDSTGLPGTDVSPDGSTVLDPAEEVTPDLDELPLVDLQVLHSRVTSQIEREHLSPEGPHPLTRDRQQDVTAELTRRGPARRP